MSDSGSLRAMTENVTDPFLRELLECMNEPQQFVLCRWLQANVLGIRACQLDWNSRPSVDLEKLLEDAERSAPKLTQDDHDIERYVDHWYRVLESLRSHMKAGIIINADPAPEFHVVYCYIKCFDEAGVLATLVLGAFFHELKSPTLISASWYLLAANLAFFSKQFPLALKLLLRGADVCSKRDESWAHDLRLAAALQAQVFETGDLAKYFQGFDLVKKHIDPFPKLLSRLPAFQQGMSEFLRL